MARVLIRLKLALLLHSLRGGGATFLELGALIGLLVAGWMWLVAIGSRAAPAAAFDSLAVALALWAVGWVLVSMSAGGDPLHPEFFRLIPVSLVRLGSALVAASFVGVLPETAILAIAAIVGATLLVGGWAPALVAVVAMAGTLIVVVLLAKVVTGAVGQASNSRVGIEVAGFAQGLLIALIWIWIPIAAIAAAPGSTAAVGAATALPTLARALPTGWGVVAAEAAARGDWLLAAIALVGIAVAGIALTAVWLRLLERRLTGARAGGGPAREAASLRARPARPLPAWLPANPFGATVRKELRAWGRQPRREVDLRGAIRTAAIVAVLPAAFGSTVLLPFAGLAVLLTAAVTASNLYGMDGSAIWLTVQAPGTERVDVRGRQLAWLLVFGPIALIGTVVFTAISGQSWAWPWVLAALPALAGASVGLIPWIALLLPGPLPERRGADPLDPGDDPRTTGALVTQGVVMTFLPLVLVAPAAVVVWMALPAGESIAAGLGVAAGVASGALYSWLFGLLAGRRLAAHGPELLERMRSRPAPRPKNRAEKAAARDRAVPTTSWVAVLAGSLLLFPQAIVPLLILVSGSETRLWFVPLYLPPALQLPAIAVSAVAGIGAYVVAWRIAADHRRRSR